MAEANRHYYATRDPFGAKGDFVTAPEISQMFGELIGLWSVETWNALGRPTPVNLVELGPGRGTLMADALRAARAAPAFASAMRLHMIETSPALIGKQREALAAFGSTWHENLDAVPEGPLIVIANEFFDALPIRQFERAPRGWHERLVGLDASGAFHFALAPDPVAGMAMLPGSTPPGSVVEICAAAEALAEQIARRIVAAGGAALIVDYGTSCRQPGGTLQALRGHARHPPLEAPGSADLTAHVDFKALARAAETAGARAWGPVAQGDFLSRLGIAERASALSRRATHREAGEIRAAVERLTGADGMGTLFQVLALTAPGAAPPAGFESPV